MKLKPQVHVLTCKFLASASAPANTCLSVCLSVLICLLVIAFYGNSMFILTASSFPFKVLHLSSKEVTSFLPYIELFDLHLSEWVVVIASELHSMVP